MAYFTYGLLLLANILFWGVGLSRLVTPARYRRFSLVFAPVAGLSLQSLVAWLGAWTNLPGTDSYAGWTMLLPLVLLGAAVWRDRQSHCRHGWAGLRWLWLLTGLQLVVLISPLAFSGQPLTTSSMGSLDAADYAAGARVLQEFGHHDRTGFLGQTEVVSVGVVDNFYDFWLRTNHFTPSALMALNGSLLKLAAHQIVGLLTVVILASVSPIVFWLARSGFRYSNGLSLAITAIYAVNPINWYAAFNVAPAQLLAANAIGLLTWCGIVAWRNVRGVFRGIGPLFGLLLVGYTLLLGAYNFMVVACLAPAVGYAWGSALLSKRRGDAVRWTLVMLVPLVVAGAIYATRTLGVFERFVLLEAGFGWDVPILGPEGWLGMVEGSWLRPHPGAARVFLLVFALVVLFLPLARALPRRRARVAMAAMILFPVVCGYSILQARHVLAGNNGSYDAYKLLSVFYPAVVCALFCGIEAWLCGSRVQRWSAWLAVACVFVTGLWGEWRVAYRMSSPRFAVEERHLKIRALEEDGAITSVNMRITDVWSKLWANVMLLKKRQFFDISTYEGRRAVGLKGDWDLVGPFFVLTTTNPDDCRQPSDRFTAIRRASPAYLEAKMGEGWSDYMGGTDRGAWWTRWAAGETASLELINPQAETLRVKLSIQLSAFDTRTCEVRSRGVVLGRLEITRDAPATWSTDALLLPPGETLIELYTPEAPVVVPGRVGHAVTLAVGGCRVQSTGLSAASLTQ